MGKLVRKNLMVDDVKVKELARILETSESEAVRQAVDHRLSLAEITDALTKLNESGGILDVFNKVPLEVKRRWRRESRSRIRRSSSR